jgi:hypothetical protein
MLYVIEKAASHFYLRAHQSQRQHGARGDKLQVQLGPLVI